MREKENLTLLGNQQTEYRMDYDPSVLEAFQNKHPEYINKMAENLYNTVKDKYSIETITVKRAEFYESIVNSKL